MPSASILIHHSPLSLYAAQKIQYFFKARSLSNLAVTEMHIKVKTVLFSDYPIPSQNRGIVIAQAISN
jgi:hypothetical protein